MQKLRLTSLIVLTLTACCASAQQAAQVWTGSWAAAPLAAPASSSAINPEGITYRDIVHLSLGGNAIRLRISNEFGTSPLLLGSVHVAISSGSGTSATQPQTDHTATFGGVESVTIPAGTVIVSDPVAMPVAPFANLAVSLFVPAQTAPTLTYHSLASSSNYTDAGNTTSAPILETATKIGSWYLLKGVEVDAGNNAASVVVLGASISDGAHSTTDKNTRWPDDLAVRLHDNKATANIGVLNEGIGGNRLLHDNTGPSALARFDRDVLAQPGAKYVILSIATNDIGRTFFPQRPNEPVTAEQIIWGYKQIVARAHARGIKVIGTTLNPFAGAGYYNEAGEQIRKAVNQFTRSGGVFDGFIDFDLVTRDPTHVEALLPAYDSGDHLHPNDSGYKVMADAIDLTLFTK
jgi:lysophospholipase L1-like esterase